MLITHVCFSREVSERELSLLDELSFTEFMLSFSIRRELNSSSRPSPWVCSSWSKRSLSNKWLMSSGDWCGEPRTTSPLWGVCSRVMISVSDGRWLSPTGDLWGENCLWSGVHKSKEMCFCPNKGVFSSSSSLSVSTPWSFSTGDGWVEFFTGLGEHKSTTAGLETIGFAGV